MSVFSDLKVGDYFAFWQTSAHKSVRSYIQKRTERGFIGVNYSDDVETDIEGLQIANEPVEIIPTARHDGRPLQTFEELADWALSVQDAVNLTGVVSSFHRVSMHLRQRLELEGIRHTDAVNTHPINVLYADKVATLADGSICGAISTKTFQVAYSICLSLKTGMPHADLLRWHTDESEGFPRWHAVAGLKEKERQA